MFALSQLSRSLEQAKIVGTAQRDLSKENGGGVGWRVGAVTSCHSLLSKRLEQAIHNLCF